MDYRFELNKFLHKALKKEYPDLPKVKTDSMSWMNFRLPTVLVFKEQDFQRMLKLSIDEDYFKPFNPILPRAFSLYNIKPRDPSRSR